MLAAARKKRKEAEELAPVIHEGNRDALLASGGWRGMLWGGGGQEGGEGGMWGAGKGGVVKGGRGRRGVVITRGTKGGGGARKCHR